MNLHGSLERDTFGAVERRQVQADVAGPDALPDGSYYRCISCPCLFWYMIQSLYLCWGHPQMLRCCFEPLLIESASMP